MKQADTLVTHVNGKEERWYSAEFMQEQYKTAYQVGIREGIPVVLHICVTTEEERSISAIFEQLKIKVDEKYSEFTDRVSHLNLSR